jgi:hypothetical protein
MRNVIQVLRNQLPVAVTVEKSARCAAWITFAGKSVLPRIVQVALQSGAQRFDPLSAGAGQQHDAVAPEGGDILGVGGE